VADVSGRLRCSARDAGLGSSDGNVRLAAERDVLYAFAARINAGAAIPVGRMARKRFPSSVSKATPTS